MAGCGSEFVHEQDVNVECWSSASTLPARILLCGHVTTHELAMMYGQMFPCMLCGKPAPSSGLTLDVPDFVPPANLSWSAPGRKKRIVTAKDGLIFEQLLARMSAGAQHVHLQGQRLRPQHVTRAVDSFLVWRATTAGCTIEHGTIALPKDGVLLLTGRGLRFRRCTFSGALCSARGHAAAAA
eukprot:jgi/Ulvmu1/6298/UM029_0005.1